MGLDTPQSNEEDAARMVGHEQAGAEKSQGFNCREIDDLVPAFAIGATDAEEAEFVKHGLSQCHGAATQLREYGEVAQAILFSAPYVSAPARSERRLREAIGGSSALTHVVFAADGHRRRRFRALPRLHWHLRPLQSVAAGMIVLLVAVNLYGLAQDQRLRQTQAALSSKIDRQNEAMLLLASGKTQQVALPPVDQNSHAQAAVLWSPDFDVAVLYAKLFPPLAPNHEYQLWLVHDGVRMSAGLFSVNQDGDGTLIFRPSQPLNTFDTLGVTPEPAGGSPGPTAPPVVRIRL